MNNYIINAYTNLKNQKIKCYNGKDDMNSGCGNVINCSFYDVCLCSNIVRCT